MLFFKQVYTNLTALTTGVIILLLMEEPLCSACASQSDTNWNRTV